MLYSSHSEQTQPVKKLIKLGSRNLSNTELLSILLRSNTQSIQEVEALLSRLGSLHALFTASYPTLSQHSSINLTKYAQIQAAQELNRRALFEPIQHNPLRISSVELSNYLIAELNNKTQEIFACLFLDSQLKLIRFEKLFAGTLNMTAVHPRVIAKYALDHNATAIIAAHNHPSGNLNPSLEDQRVTEHIVQVLSLFDIELLDHLIIGGNQTLSFRQHGLL